MSTRSLNKVILIGNLTRDPEVRYTSSGTPVATFGLATNRAFKDSTGKAVETVEYHNIVTWSKLAEICGKLLKKGMKVYIEGRLQTNSWVDKDTNKNVYRTEIVAVDMFILNSKNSRGDGNSSDNFGADPDDTDAVDFDNLDIGSNNLGSSDDPNKTPF